MGERWAVSGTQPLLLASEAMWVLTRQDVTGGLVGLWSLILLETPATEVTLRRPKLNLEGRTLGAPRSGLRSAGLLGLSREDSVSGSLINTTQAQRWAWMGTCDTGIGHFELELLVRYHWRMSLRKARLMMAREGRERIESCPRGGATEQISVIMHDTC